MQELIVRVWVESDNHVDHHSLERGVLAGLRYAGFNETDCHVTVEEKPQPPDCFMCRGEDSWALDKDLVLYRRDEPMCPEHRAAREHVMAAMRNSKG